MLGLPYPNEGVIIMARLLAYINLITTAFFALIVISLHFLSPDLDPIVSGISFYALTQYDLLLNLALSLIGVSGIVIAFGMWLATTSILGRAGLLLIIAWGLFSILAGLFPLDAPGSPPTLSGTIHNLAGLNFLLITPALLLIELSRSAGGYPVRPRTITFWLAWLLLVSALLLFTFNGPQYYLGIGGVFQRLYWVVLVLWLLFNALQILGQDSPSQQSVLSAH
jgi:hypothetical protein